MTGAVRKLKVNTRYASSGCVLCGDLLALGEEGAVCEACEAPHHASCWEAKNGCGQPDCVNAPLREAFNTRDSESGSAANEMLCPHCRQRLPLGTAQCSGCHLFTTTTGLYEGVRKTADDARDAFLLGIAAVIAPQLVGLSLYYFNISGATWLPALLGIQCGWSAIAKARKGRKAITNDQRLKGRGLAIAAQVLGSIGVALPVLSFIGMLLLLSGR